MPWITFLKFATITMALLLYKHFGKPLLGLRVNLQFMIIVKLIHF